MNGDISGMEILLFEVKIHVIELLILIFNFLVLLGCLLYFIFGDIEKHLISQPFNSKKGTLTLKPFVPLGEGDTSRCFSHKSASGIGMPGKTSAQKKKPDRSLQATSGNPLGTSSERLQGDNSTGFSSSGALKEDRVCCNECKTTFLVSLKYC